MRIGILGAAAIAASSLVRPAKLVDGVEIAAIAARDAERAAVYARKHGIPASYGGYDALLADETIDAVYIPLPNAVHGEWTKRALAAGKHVLCEKPFTANAAEAREVAAVGAAHPELTLMEAFHYRYHPLSLRVLELIAGDEIGEIERIDATLCVPMWANGRNIRWSLPLAGGSMMDLGCYAVHMVRTFSGEEPAVASAEARTLANPKYAGVDRWLRAELAFPSGATGSTTVAMQSSTLLSLRLDVRGTKGSLSVFRGLSPHFFGRLRVRTPSRSWSEGTTRRPSYAYQLEAFRDAVARKPTNLTTAADAVKTMTVIDAAYAAAGMSPREPLPARP